jgi:hypothetical protein
VWAIRPTIVHQPAVTQATPLHAVPGPYGSARSRQRDPVQISLSEKLDVPFPKVAAIAQAVAGEQETADAELTSAPGGRGGSDSCHRGADAVRALAAGLAPAVGADATAAASAVTAVRPPASSIRARCGRRLVGLILESGIAGPLSGRAWGQE